MQNRKDVQKRNVVLKIETYEKLEKYKAKLIGEKGDSRLTFDDVINELVAKATTRKRETHHDSEDVPRHSGL
jgi:hypothetical protein